MASKRTRTRTRPVSVRSLKTVRTLTQKAQTELVKLLGQNKRGTISKAKLDMGLTKLKKKLVKILMHEYKI